ncbi:MAG TPA: hypothetical protein VFL57_05920, partial [Bryobacteraceae bacterium]|nr:hypothetical protein [Bryobacteraceae bacterium]
SALFGGVYQYGYTMHVYNTLETSVANATRAAARSDMRSDRKDEFRNLVRQLVVYGNTAGTGSPVVPNLRPEHVAVTWAPDSTANPPMPPQTVTVSINGYTVDGMFGRVTLHEKPRLTMRYAGHFMIPLHGGGTH